MFCRWENELGLRLGSDFVNIKCGWWMVPRPMWQYSPVLLQRQAQSRNKRIKYAKDGGVSLLEDSRSGRDDTDLSTVHIAPVGALLLHIRWWFNWTYEFLRDCSEQCQAHSAESIMVEKQASTLCVRKLLTLSFERHPGEILTFFPWVWNTTSRL